MKEKPKSDKPSASEKSALQRKLEEAAETVINIVDKTVKTKKAIPTYNGHGSKIEFTKRVLSSKGGTTEYAVPMTAGEFTKITGISTGHSDPQGGYAFLSLDESSVRFDLNPSGKLVDL